MRYSQKQSKSKSIGAEDSIYGLPTVALLNDKHWFYIQRRYRMSPRELQVAKLVCQGLDNKQIANDLKIKQGTVKTHLRNIYRRIRVKNKIKMLLKFVDAAAKLSTQLSVTPPMPIINTEKNSQALSIVSHKKIS